MDICFSNALLSYMDKEGITVNDLFPNVSAWTISFADDAKTIPSSHFANTSIDEITIPDSVTCIKSCAFEYCESLESVTIGNSVKEIADDAFSGCDALENVYLGSQCPLKKREIIDLFPEDCNIERL